MKDAFENLKKTFERYRADAFYCRQFEIRSETVSKLKREGKVTHEMEKKLVVVIDCLCAEHLCPTFEDVSSFLHISMELSSYLVFGCSLCVRNRRDENLNKKIFFL